MDSSSADHLESGLGIYSYFLYVELFVLVCQIEMIL